MRREKHPAVTAGDLPEIFIHIAEDDLAAADRVLAAIEATFRQIARQPSSGVVYVPKNRRIAPMRMLPVQQYRNYLIFYRSNAEVLRILYVVHGARHLPRLFNRERRV